MIRVLHVVTDMNRGGLETMIMNYYRCINREKVQFDFLTHRSVRSSYDDEIEALGGKIYRISRLIPWSIRYRKQLEAFFSMHPEYRIVHVHQDCLSSVILHCAESCKVPVRIAHSHTSNQKKNLRYLVKLFYKRLIPKYATQLFACGKAAGDWMFGAMPYIVLNNAVPSKLFIYSPEHRAVIRKEFFGEEFDGFVVGHVGSFWELKNHSFLIDIFAKINKVCPNSKLVLVGDGGRRQEIQNKVMELGLQNSVVFTGVRSDVHKIMQAMDVFVLPSLYEGLPVTMVEAQASGLPCFISDKVPLDCKITDSVFQLALDKSPEEWAESILSMKNQKRKNNYDIIKEAGFDIDENANWLQSFYLDQWKAIT